MVYYVRLQVVLVRRRRGVSIYFLRPEQSLTIRVDRAFRRSRLWFILHRCQYFAARQSPRFLRRQDVDNSVFEGAP